MLKWFSIFFFLFAKVAGGQDCSLTISGNINDHHSQEQLAFATLRLEESGQSAVANLEGFYQFKNICSGQYHLIVDHIGCETERYFIQILSDTIVNITLHHHEELLQEVTVSENSRENNGAASLVISEASILEESGKTLGEITQTIAGVSTLKNGAGISKPVIHGLYGNRVAILNNGVQQAGQQWGNDHAPEIDPLAANRITVVKGSSALRYGTGALGGMLLIEPGNISRDPHLHGRLQYVAQSNGRQHLLHTQLERGAGSFQWRASGSWQNGGDQRAPDYFLNNTGNRQASGSLQLKKTFSENWNQSAYYSFFNTQLGVLRGAHIGGNVDNLKAAFNRTTPFFTDENFSRELKAPKQAVTHHFWKTSGNLFLENHHHITWSYTGQFNHRKEFDVRRSGRSEIPALDMKLLSQHFNVNHFLPLKENHELEYGFQALYNRNRNSADTGILPLIPFYNLFQPAVYVNIKNTNTQLLKYDFGIRYDYQDLLVKNITSGSDPKIETIRHQFNNFAAVAGVSLQPSKIYQPKLSINFLQRAPGVNELYSAGLHQGVSGIEEGVNTLQSETALKFIFSNTLRLENKLFLEANAYFQHIENYIFLQPEPELRPTIRGIFPVFKYRQTNAALYGLDLLGKWAPNNHWEWIGKYAFVHGRDVSTNSHLIYIPADNISSELSYLIDTQRKWTNTKFSIKGQYIFEQKRFDETLDFLPPPAGYFLLGIEAGSTYKVGEKDLSIFLDVENLLNIKYRDYLNRLRYFSDERGINVRLNLLYTF